MEWEVVIGLEVHAQLATQSKIFSGAATKYGALPNTQACLVDLGMPGVLPVLNKEVIRMAVKFGLAIDAVINQVNVFARKNYFYPDLPKGYQISQFDLPIVGEGCLDILLDNGEMKRVGITRAHLEEDAGKSLHEGLAGATGVDLNRAGTPLLEIVSEPDMRSSQEAVAYLKTLHTLVKYLEICDGNMQEGSFRCDANVSVRPKGQEAFGTRAEIKNVNSFRFVEKAIDYEVLRQIALIESGGEVLQETRLYDESKNETRSMRSKESAHDYRYFPDPDLLPVKIDEQVLLDIKSSLPELPWEKSQRFQSDYQLSQYDAAYLASQKAIANYFEAVLASLAAQSIQVPAKLVVNWMMGELAANLNKAALSMNDAPISPERFALLLVRITDDTISGKIAKEVFEGMWGSELTADDVIEKSGLKQVNNVDEIKQLIEDVCEQYPEQVVAYRSGQDKLFGFFVGQVMKLTKGKANPGQVNQLLKQKL